MTWRRAAKSLHALVAHGLLFTFTVMLVLKLHHTVRYPWWFVILISFSLSFFLIYIVFYKCLVVQKIVETMGVIGFLRKLRMVFDEVFSFLLHLFGKLKSPHFLNL